MRGLHIILVAIALAVVLVYVFRQPKDEDIPREASNGAADGLFRYVCSMCRSRLYLHSLRQCPICGAKDSLMCRPSGLVDHNDTGLSVKLWLATCRADSCSFKSQRESETLAGVIGCPIHGNDHMDCKPTGQEVTLSGANVYSDEAYELNA